MLFLAQFRPRLVAHQRMMEIPGRFRSAEHPSEANLPSRRRQKILATDNEVDAVPDVVDGNGELVAPLPKPVAQQQVAALALGTLGLRTQEAVPERLGWSAAFPSQPQAVADGLRMPGLSAEAGIRRFASLRRTLEPR